MTTPTSPTSPTLILAPLRGVTGYVFRTAHARHFGGFDWAVSPFVPTVKGVVVKKSHMRDLMPQNNREMLVVPQLIGNDADDFVTLANQVADLGYTEVNWNLGCPHPNVTGKRRGAGLIPHPGIVAGLLDRIVPRIKPRLSIKVRLGMHSPDELGALLPVLDRYPLVSITIHPRTADQQYEGVVDLPRFGRYMLASKHPVTYNGDIRTCSDLAHVRELFPGVTTVMIGRGAIANPFLPGLIKGARAESDPVSRVRLFHDQIYQTLGMAGDGPSPLLGALKELWGFLALSFDNGPKALKKIQKTRSVPEYEDVTARVLSGAVRWIAEA